MWAHDFPRTVARTRAEWGIPLETAGGFGLILLAPRRLLAIWARQCGASREKSRW